MTLFLQRLLDENKRRYETRSNEIARMLPEIEAAERVIVKIEHMLGNSLRLDLPVEDNMYFPRPLHLGENHHANYSTRLHDVLLSLGFAEVYRLNVKYGLWDHVVFQLADLHLSIKTRPGYRLPAVTSNQRRRRSDAKVPA